GVGKWINNLGAIGTGIAAAVLIGLGAIVYLRFGTNVTAADFQIPANPRFVLNSFGVICFGLVGLELASVMGDEIENPQKILPGAVAWGGVLSGLLYIGATLTLLIAVSKKDISVLQGIVQAVGSMAARVNASWIVAPFAILLSFSIAGIGSAWLAGSGGIPFVVCMILVIVKFYGGAALQETLQKLLSLAGTLQLVPLIYMFGALLKLAAA